MLDLPVDQAGWFQSESACRRMVSASSLPRLPLNPSSSKRLAMSTAMVLALLGSQPDTLSRRYISLA
jgi:hypothetical protein